MTLFYINIYQSFFIARKSWNWHVRQRQRDRRRGHRIAEDYYIDLFLTYVAIPYSRPYVFASLTSGSQPGSAVGNWPLDETQRTSDLTWLCLQMADRDSLWLTIWHRYPSIYNFITPTRSSGLWFTWSAHTHASLAFRQSLCLHSWNILSQWSLIDNSVKCQYASSLMLSMLLTVIILFNINHLPSYN